MISNETRKKWDDKIETILQAVELGLLKLKIQYKEDEFFDSIQIRRSKEIDLTRKQSKWLADIFERIE